jgi:penicillin-binding protein 1C
VGNAAPVLFDIFSLLPDGGWFEAPLGEMERVAVCRKSGHRASPDCEEVDTLHVPRAGLATEPCPYHRTIHLSADGLYRVNSGCEPTHTMLTRSWFVLPPAQAYYYRQHNVDYRSLPPWRAGCEPQENASIEVIYPEHGAILYLPRGFSGEREHFVFRAAHARTDAILYWHLDDQYLGQTTDLHEMACQTGAGTHLLTLSDPWGSQRKIQFEVLAR